MMTPLMSGFCSFLLACFISRGWSHKEMAREWDGMYKKRRLGYAALVGVLAPTDGVASVVLYLCSLS